MLEFLPFLLSPPDSLDLYPENYNLRLVFLSVAVAVLASYFALYVAPKIRQAESRTAKLTWVGSGALTMGLGTWAMHFIGMLSLNLPCGVTYNPALTLLSLAPAVLASAIALRIIAGSGNGLVQTVFGGILLGAGIGAMHYTGMAAMTIEGAIRYAPFLFFLSIVVAIGLAFIALQVRATLKFLGRWRDPAAALVMGGAISGMHYTAMDAVYFVKGTAVVIPTASAYSPEYLAIMVVAISALLALLAGLIAAAYQSDTARKLRETEERWEFALDTSGDGVWDWDIVKNKVLFSKQWKIVLGYGEDEACPAHSEWMANIHPDDLPAVLGNTERCLSGEVAEFNSEYRLLCKDGGYKWIMDRGRVVSRDREGHPTRMIGTNTDITHRKAAEERITQLAFYDPLTDLPNRRLLMDRLQHALSASMRNGTGGALFFVDLDQFKILNDTLGHDTGDRLLHQAARRLLTWVRESDTVARLGGDEFVIMLDTLSDNPEEAASQAEVVGEKIRAAFTPPFQLIDHDYHSTPSIGVTLFGAKRTSVDELLKEADIAMYQAKAAGRNTMRFFDPDLQAAVQARSIMEEDLRRGIESGQFFLTYQPQVNGNRIIGAEALIRWRHPERGIVSPLEFIPLAEETGLILPLGRWVLESACAQLLAWAAQPHTAELTLAVNVSARQFRQADFVEQVQSVLNRTRVEPSKLKLELTESLLIDDVDAVIAKMAALKACGVSFSLDDFGTGYSSLSYLKRLPLSQLKIDQSFVRDILVDSYDAAIARTVITLAQSIGLTVIAEGVETEAQRQFLADNNCHTYQGYLFSRPVPADEFEALLNASRASVMSYKNTNVGA